ncbi:S41 family peptidase [Candidatus Saccharibacteria bacterium]|nr:S41 family peptidase [Candidatus Saccharibacteria bacterium]
MQQNISDSSSQSNWRSRLVVIIVVLTMVFVMGYGVGNGNISLGRGRADSVSNNLPDNLNYRDVEALYDKLRENYDGKLTEAELIEGLKEGLVNAAGDQYTQYLTPKEAKEFDQELNGTFSGIGARLMEDKNKMVMVETPLAGYPAEKSGLKARDVIIEINGESALDMSVSDAVDKIRGEEGTKVKIKVSRDGREQLDFEITRETISIPSVESKILEGNIGYLQVSRFDETTGELARQAAQEFKDTQVKGVVLDLRNNPGGLLDAAVSLSGIWLPQGKTVLQEKRDGKVIKTYESDGPAILKDFKTVVLINEGSASASEITAGALRDNDAATLLGEKSFGKGSVQTLERLSNGGILKVTIARWFTPNGKNIDKTGIEPDKKVERSIEDVQKGRDPQLDAAIGKIKS